MSPGTRSLATALHVVTVISETQVRAVASSAAGQSQDSLSSCKHCPRMHLRCLCQVQVQVCASAPSTSQHRERKWISSHSSPQCLDGLRFLPSVNVAPCCAGPSLVIACVGLVQLREIELPPRRSRLRICGAHTVSIGTEQGSPEGTTSSSKDA